MSHPPEQSDPPESAAPVTEASESDPNADSADGLGGDMGVSSERKGPVRGAPGQVTYAAAPLDLSSPEGDVPPEQSARDARPEVRPESPGAHESDPEAHPGHGV